ncbi:MAG: sodium:proton antiporter [Leptolyngbyaceae cyanobacterium SL_7_1]|nr:sodium:proton antiporter [Leptolyngbyaceae cyanobacterium SL_7_1]
MDSTLEITLLMVITVVAGISAQVLADYLKVPSIVFLLLFGMVLGSDGLGVLHPQLLGSGLEVIVALCVALILFEGGLNLELRDLGRVSGSLRNMVTFGTLITFIAGGMAAHWLGEFPWTIAFLYASLVVVTGPTVINPLLKQVKVDRQVSALLEGEGVLIDPVGAILAVVVLDVILNGDADVALAISGLGLRLGIGVAIGAAGGWLMGVLLKQTKFLSDELKNLVVLAGLWGLFGIAQVIRSESGLMATVVAGIVLRGSSIPDERLLRRFKGQLTILAVSVLFILLSADLSIASVFALGRGAVFTVAILMFVVRPFNVWVCTWNSDLNWRQKLFVCWIAPRGIVSASVASLFAILLTERGISGGDAIKALVFLTIISTVFLQGLSAGWVARLLKITSTEAIGVVIVGCNPLSRLIAQLFQSRQEPAVLIDTNGDACQLAETEGLKVFTSSALDTDVLEMAGLATAGTFLAMTNNGEVNLVLAQRAIEEFQPPRVLAIFPTELQSTSVTNPKIHQAFMPHASLKTWSRYLSDNTVKLGETTVTDNPDQLTHLKSLATAETLLPLLCDRQGRLLIAQGWEDWQPGDRLIYLFNAPRSSMLRRLTGVGNAVGPKPETIAEVEDIPQVPLLEPIAQAALELTPETVKADLS